MDISMTETKITLRKLTAADGFVLTDGEVYGKEIYLGKNDSPDNWHEITEAEHTEILAEQEQTEEV